jgi:hypothetical protein
MKVIGFILIVLGVIGFAYGGISWTRNDEVLDAGPIEITTERRESVPFTPIASGICLVAGVVLVVAGSRRA